MAKIFTEVGFVITEDDGTGVWEEKEIKRGYYGDLIRNPSSRWQSTDQINDNKLLSNNVSILADPFAFENFTSIRFVTIMGKKWKVDNIEIQYPRLILTTGGLYNA